jgi:nucleoside-diphosphate-sugar epimerase
MVEIGGKPILWHIMKTYSAHGVNDFVIGCGYKGSPSGSGRKGGHQFARAWNFGPDQTGDASVMDVAGAVARNWGNARVEVLPADNLYEADTLRLDSSGARREIGWRPRWSLSTALEQTVRWHRAHLDGVDMPHFTVGQIQLYESGGRA